MASINQAQDSIRKLSRKRIHSYPIASKKFHWLIAILASILLSGIYLDGWAHTSLRDRIETFLTPWHSILYLSMLVMGGTLSFAYASNLGKGYSLRTALPQGYISSLVGFFIFAFGGAFDFLWHSLVGFEGNVEALISPAHLILALGAMLLISGPLRALWLDKTPRQGWSELGPAIVSLTAVVSLLTFFTAYANAVGRAYNLVTLPNVEEASLWQVVTISYFLTPAFILSWASLLVIRRWTLPRGFFTFLLTANALLMFWLGIAFNLPNWPMLLGVMLAGICSDFLYFSLKPSLNSKSLRIFACLIPFVYSLAILTALILNTGVWWRAHMWLGAPILAAVIGYGLSYLLVAPAFSEDPATKELPYIKAELIDEALSPTPEMPFPGFRSWKS